MALKLRFLVLASSMAITAGCTCTNEVNIGGSGGSMGAGGNTGTGGNTG